MPPLYTLIISLFTVIASGVVSSIVTFQLNKSKELAAFMREKAEKLYLSADEFGKDVSCYVVAFFPVIDGRVSYNDMLDLQLKNRSEKKHGGAETMTMLTEIYFPEVSPKLKHFLSCKDRFNDLVSEHKGAYARGEGIAGDWSKKFRAIAVEISRSLTDLEKSIISAGRLYAPNKRVFNFLGKF